MSKHLRERQSEVCLFLRLPEEILVEMLEWLDKSALLHVSATCTWLRQRARDDRLWRRRYAMRMWVDKADRAFLLFQAERPSHGWFYAFLQALHWCEQAPKVRGPRFCSDLVDTTYGGATKMRVRPDARHTFTWCTTTFGAPLLAITSQTYRVAVEVTHVQGGDGVYFMLGICERPEEYLNTFIGGGVAHDLSESSLRRVNARSMGLFLCRGLGDCSRDQLPTCDDPERTDCDALCCRLQVEMCVDFAKWSISFRLRQPESTWEKPLPEAWRTTFVPRWHMAISVHTGRERTTYRLLTVAQEGCKLCPSKHAL